MFPMVVPLHIQALWSVLLHSSVMPTVSLAFRQCKVRNYFQHEYRTNARVPFRRYVRETPKELTQHTEDQHSHPNFPPSLLVLFSFVGNARRVQHCWQCTLFDCRSTDAMFPLVVSMHTTSTLVDSIALISEAYCCNGLAIVYSATLFPVRV